MTYIRTRKVITLGFFERINNFSLKTMLTYHYDEEIVHEKKLKKADLL